MKQTAGAVSLHGGEVNERSEFYFTTRFVYYCTFYSNSTAMMPLPYCVYVLFSHKDHLLYIGFSTHLQKRIIKHNSGEVTSTSPRRPLDLIFCEFYLFKEDASKREKYFKTTMWKKALKLMLNGTFEKLGYKGQKLNYQDLE